MGERASRILSYKNKLTILGGTCQPKEFLPNMKRAGQGKHSKRKASQSKQAGGEGLNPCFKTTWESLSGTYRGRFAGSAQTTEGGAEAAKS